MSNSGEVEERRSPLLLRSVRETSRIPEGVFAGCQCSTGKIISERNGVPGAIGNRGSPIRCIISEFGHRAKRVRQQPNAAV